MPTAAPGFEVSLFADKLDNPRQAYVLPNNDIFVVEATREWPGRADRPEKSANRITLFRDTNNDGKPDLRETFLTGLNMPHGMAAAGQLVLRRQHRRCGALSLPSRANQNRRQRRKVLDLPAGGHYTRNLIADPAGKKIYVAIGSASNVDEENAVGKRPAARRHCRNQSRRQRHADVRQRSAQSGRHGLGAADQDPLDRRQ